LVTAIDFASNLATWNRTPSGQFATIDLQLRNKVILITGGARGVAQLSSEPVPRNALRLRCSKGSDSSAHAGNGQQTCWNTVYPSMQLYLPRWWLRFVSSGFRAFPIPKKRWRVWWPRLRSKTNDHARGNRSQSGLPAISRSGHTTGLHLFVDGGYVHLDRAL